MSGLLPAYVGQILEVMSWVLIALGSFFVVVGAIGLVRMPDIYTRMHASSVTETLGASLLIIGLMLQTDLVMTNLKLLVILGIIFFTGPVVSHALAQASLHAGVEPILHEDRTDRLDQADTDDGNGRQPSNS